MGACDLRLAEYVRELESSGFPGIRSLGDRTRRVQFESYLPRALSREIVPERIADLVILTTSEHACRRRGLGGRRSAGTSGALGPSGDHHPGRGGHWTRRPKRYVEALGLPVIETGRLNHGIIERFHASREAR